MKCQLSERGVSVIGMWSVSHWNVECRSLEYGVSAIVMWSDLQADVAQYLGRRKHFGIVSAKKKSGGEGGDFWDLFSAVRKLLDRWNFAGIVSPARSALTAADSISTNHQQLLLYI